MHAGIAKLYNILFQQIDVSYSGWDTLMIYHKQMYSLPHIIMVAASLCQYRMPKVVRMLWTSGKVVAAPFPPSAPSLPLPFFILLPFGSLPLSHTQLSPGPGVPGGGSGHIIIK